jgi:transposase
MRQWICGPWMRCTFNNTGRAVGCGFHQEIKDLVLQHHPTRKSVGYFGAVRLRDGKFLFAREHDRFNAKTTWEFLRLLHSRSLKSRRRVVVIIDNAKYHHAKLHRAWRQKHESQFRLDYLPPYSPDLNPIERVWKLTRKLCIHDEYFSSLDAVITVVEAQFAQWDRFRKPSHQVLLFHCKATRMGIKPSPAVNGRRALPITAPKALRGSSAFMACPGVGDVVKRSPILMRPYWASALQ